MNGIIEKRRSIRKYQNREISNEIIDDLLYHASLAPSAHNKQHWYYVVVKDELKNNIGDLLKNSDRGSVIVTSNVIKECSALILVYKEVEDIYADISIGASIENILLRAVDLGLGACWCGAHPQERVEENLRKCLNLDKNIIPLNIIFIGYPNESPEARHQYDENKVHFIK